MKNVLVLLHDDEGQEARLQAALDLTRALAGHLMCLDIVTLPELPTDYFSGVGGAMALDLAREHESENCRAIAARLQKEDVPWSMLESSERFEEDLRNASDLADIIVVSTPGRHDAVDARHVAGEVALKSGRPLLAVPPTCRGIVVSGNVLVAWNGSHEANEALCAAVPLLRHAASVTLLKLNNPDGEFSAEDAAGYLSRYGVHPEIVERSSPDPVSDAILDQARAMEAAYVVVGAFGLPRVVEAVFGGVTVGMLRKSEIPLLLAH